MVDLLELVLIRLKTVADDQTTFFIETQRKFIYQLISPHMYATRFGLSVGHPYTCHHEKIYRKIKKNIQMNLLGRNW